MKIAKIKNRYMFNSSNPNGTHDYLVYKDKKSGENRAVELTHLYVPDRKRFSQVKNGFLKKMRFRHRETPSGVNNSYYCRDVNGKALDFRNKNVNLNAYRHSHIWPKQSVDVMKFASRRHK